MTFEEWMSSITDEVYDKLRIGSATLISFMNDDPALCMEVVEWDMGANPNVSQMNQEGLIKYLNDHIDQYKSRYDDYIKTTTTLNLE